MLKKVIIAALVCAVLYALSDSGKQDVDDSGIVPGVTIPGVM